MEHVVVEDHLQADIPYEGSEDEAVEHQGTHHDEDAEESLNQLVEVTVID